MMKMLMIENAILLLDCEIEDGEELDIIPA